MVFDNVLKPYYLAHWKDSLKLKEKSSEEELVFDVNEQIASAITKEIGLQNISFGYAVVSKHEVEDEAPDEVFRREEANETDQSWVVHHDYHQDNVSHTQTTHTENSSVAVTAKLTPKVEFASGSVAPGELGMTYTEGQSCETVDFDSKTRGQRGGVSGKLTPSSVTKAQMTVITEKHTYTVDKVYVPIKAITEREKGKKEIMISFGIKVGTGKPISKFDKPLWQYFDYVADKTGTVFLSGKHIWRRKTDSLRHQSSSGR